MKIFIAIIAILAIGMFLVMSQTTPRTLTAGATPTVPTATTTAPEATVATNETPPLVGANSFTETQAKDRIEAAGFVSVVALVKDQDGIWRASAMKSGTAVKVALDFKGNVVVN